VQRVSGECARCYSWTGGEDSRKGKRPSQAMPAEEIPRESVSSSEGKKAAEEERREKKERRSAGTIDVY
jgi:hypothetical protein